MDGGWSVSEEFNLKEARFGHCAALVSKDKIVVIGGHSEAIIDSVEIINISNHTVELLPDLKTPHKRWGISCTAQDNKVTITAQW